MAPKDVAISESWIVVFKSGAEGAEAINFKGESVLSHRQLADMAEEYNGKVVQFYANALPGMALQMSETNMKRLAQHPNVKYIDQDAIVRKDQVPPSWGLDRVDQRELPLDNTPFSPRNDGSGVRAYVIDTGIFILHEEFEGRAEWGANFVNDNIDDDCDGHGTHVSGTIAGKTFGVGRKTNLVAVKVLGCTGSGTTSGVIGGVEWAMTDANAHPESKATANMSLGGSYSQALNDAVGEMVDSGVITSVSAGNSDTDACTQSPAAEPRVITVASTTITDTRSYFSNYGTCVDIFAPGSNITSAWIGSDTATNTISGTSMASPHVTGGAGLILSGGADPEDAIHELKAVASKVTIGDKGPNSPDLLLYVGDVAPTISPAPTIVSSAFPTTEPTISPVPSIEPTRCDNDHITVSIRTDDWPSETSWTLVDICSGLTIDHRARGFYKGIATLYEDSVCSPESETSYVFTIFDAFGDGICCTWGHGSYNVTFNGELVASGGEFEFLEATTFGLDQCPPSVDDHRIIPILAD